jgi:hypothetical protein
VQYVWQQPRAEALDIRALLAERSDGAAVAGEDQVLDLGVVRGQLVARGLARLVE